jgi:hypothetical protein
MKMHSLVVVIYDVFGLVKFPLISKALHYYFSLMIILEGHRYVLLELNMRVLVGLRSLKIS